MMNRWKNSLLLEGGTIADAIRVLDSSSAHICLVVDDEDRLKGTITDGDVRRGLLRSLSVASSAKEVMNPTPLVGRPGDDRPKLLAALRQAQMRQIPLVDDQNRVIGLETADEMTGSELRPNWVVLMAGGLGTRLRPLTEATPKPMLKVGAKPVLETTIESFIQQGFRRFYISINYLADKVKEHFGDGQRWNCEICYLEESEQLGTAGSLGLISKPIDDPIIVMNGDVLTRVNFGYLLDYHREHQAAATMCVRGYDFQVPYGVVSLDGSRIRDLAEKPIHSFFVNAGIYVIEPSLLAQIPRDGRRFHMTHLFERMLADGQPTAAFPIREYWIDIGQVDDFTRANGDYSGMFEV